MLVRRRRNNTYVKMSSAQRRSTLPGVEDMQPSVRAIIEANPDRLLWGSDWPHTGMWHDIDRLMEELEPFHPVDDGKALNLMNRCIADAGMLRKILVDNPARLSGFCPARWSKKTETIPVAADSRADFSRPPPLPHGAHARAATLVPNGPAGA